MEKIKIQPSEPTTTLPTKADKVRKTYKYVKFINKCCLGIVGDAQ